MEAHKRKEGELFTVGVLVRKEVLKESERDREGVIFIGVPGERGRALIHLEGRATGIR